MTQGFSGIGLVSSHLRTGSGGKGLGTLWGNCPKFSLALTPDVEERNSSMDVSRAPLRRLTKATAAVVTIATDEFNKKNVARAWQARVDEVAADAATTINETMPSGAVVGDVLAAKTTNINTLVVTDSTGSPKTLTLGTNYSVDLFSGHVTLLDLTTGGAFVQPFKLAYKQGAVSVLAGLAAPATDLWMAMAGTNTDDLTRGVLDVYRVKLNPASVTEYIGTTYSDFELTGTAFVDQTKTVAAVGGNVFKWSMESTHE